MDDKKRECSSLMDGLERLADMYKDGLLSDDELWLLKRSLLRRMNMPKCPNCCEELGDDNRNGTARSADIRTGRKDFSTAITVTP